MARLAAGAKLACKVRALREAEKPRARLKALKSAGTLDEIRPLLP
jgi:hypothetical protein